MKWIMNIDDTYSLFANANNNGKEDIWWWIWEMDERKRTNALYIHEKYLLLMELNESWKNGERCDTHTVRSKWKWSEAILWSKMMIFKKAFHKLRVLPHLLQPQNFWPLIRALEWGTIKRFSSRGIRMVKGQSFRVLTLLNNKSVFRNFLLLSLAVFMPLEENL